MGRCANNRKNVKSANMLISVIISCTCNRNQLIIVCGLSVSSLTLVILSKHWSLLPYYLYINVNDKDLNIKLY